jgi:hypothetical protein
MRFKQFLDENYEFDHLAVLDRIKNDCGPFIRASKGRPLLRGIPSTNNIKGADGKIEKKIKIDTTKARWNAHPSNRQPKDSWTVLGFNFMFNSMIDAAFQEENVRLRGLFATGKDEIAERYGEMHFCFPAGEIAYLWSSKIEDSFQDEFFITSNISSIIESAVSKAGDNDHYFTPHIISSIFNNLSLITKNKSHEWVYDLDGTSTEDLMSAIRKVLTAEMYEKHIANSHIDFYHLFIDALEKTAKFLYKDTEELPRAISSGNEILFYKSAGYYSVPVDVIYEEMVKRKEPIPSRYHVEEIYNFLLDEILHGSR